MFGLCATALLTDIIQLSTGYHAPFFLTVCKPNYTLAGVSCDKNAYITTDICSGQDEHAIMAARCLPYFLFVSLFEVFRLIIEACFFFFFFFLFLQKDVSFPACNSVSVCCCLCFCKCDKENLPTETSSCDFRSSGQSSGSAQKCWVGHAAFNACKLKADFRLGLKLNFPSQNKFILHKNK